MEVIKNTHCFHCYCYHLSSYHCNSLLIISLFSSPTLTIYITVYHLKVIFKKKKPVQVLPLCNATNGFMFHLSKSQGQCNANKTIQDSSSVTSLPSSPASFPQLTLFQPYWPSNYDWPPPQIGQPTHLSGLCACNFLLLKTSSPTAA